MDLSLTERQQLLKTTAAEFVEKEAPSHVITELSRKGVGNVPDLWRKASALGWTGMMTPSEYGGADTGYTDTAVIFEELGRGPVVGPFFSSGVLAPLVLLEGGSDDQKRQLLPTWAAGQRIVTLAISDPAPRFGADTVQMAATRSNGDYVLNGVKLFVHDVNAADELICAVRTGREADPARGVTLLLVDKGAPGVTFHQHDGFMAAVGEVNFENVRVPASAVIGEVGGGWPVLERAFQRALPVLCAYQVGGCQEVFEFTAEYTRTRVVFGQPIGRFQRVQDHVIELSLNMDGARWTTYEALWKLDTGQDALSSVHLAKATASEGYFKACVNSLEVHAGVGTDRQHPLVPHLIMSRSLYQYLGDPRYHKRRMMDALDF